MRLVTESYEGLSLPLYSRFLCDTPVPVPVSEATVQEKCLGYSDLVDMDADIETENPFIRIDSEPTEVKKHYTPFLRVVDVAELERVGLMHRHYETIDSISKTGGLAAGFGLTRSGFTLDREMLADRSHAALDLQRAKSVAELSTWFYIVESS